MEKDGKFTSRDWIALILLINLLINIGCAVYIGVHLPWDLLGKLSLYVSLFVIFELVYPIVISFCLFCLALFVSTDGDLIEELIQLVTERQHNSSPNDN